MNLYKLPQNKIDLSIIIRFSPDVRYFANGKIHEIRWKPENSDAWNINFMKKFGTSQQDAKGSGYHIVGFNIMFYYFDILINSILTHCGLLILSYGTIDIGQHWSIWELVAWRHEDIIRCNILLTWTNFGEILINTKHFIQGNAF